MQIEVTPKGQAAIIVIVGEIDGKTAPQAQAELQPVVQQYHPVVLDMSSVTYLSSAGLRMLLLVYRQAAAKEGKVVLVGLSEEIMDTMSMTGFLNFFQLADSVEAALEA